MRLIEIFESTDDELIAKIQSECSDMIKAINQSDVFLLRGIREGVTKPIEKTIHQERNPIFMPHFQHKVLLDAFKNLGLKANRGNSIFCTTDSDVAQIWGTVCYIFPKNGWSATVFQKIKRGYVYDEIYDVEAGDSYEESVTIWTDLLKTLKPLSIDTLEGFAKVLKARYDDILITGTSYYAIPVDLKHEDFMYKVLGRTK